MTHTSQYRPELAQRLEKILAPMSIMERREAETVFLQLLKQGTYSTLNDRPIAPKKKPEKHEPEQDK